MAIDRDRPGTGHSGYFLQILPTETLPGLRLRGGAWRIDEDGFDVHRAAVVYAPSKKTLCSVSRSRNLFARLFKFSLQNPLIGPVRGVKLLSCSVH